MTCEQMLKLTLGINGDMENQKNHNQRSHRTMLSLCSGGSCCSSIYNEVILKGVVIGTSFFIVVIVVRCGSNGKLSSNTDLNSILA